MASSVWHMRKSLPLDIIKDIIHGNALNARLVDIVELSDEFSANDSDRFAQYGDLLLCRKGYCGLLDFRA